MASDFWTTPQQEDARFPRISLTHFWYTCKIHYLLRDVLVSCCAPCNQCNELLKLFFILLLWHSWKSLLSKYHSAFYFLATKHLYTSNCDLGKWLLHWVSQCSLCYVIAEGLLCILVLFVILSHNKDLVLHPLFSEILSRYLTYEV